MGGWKFGNTRAPVLQPVALGGDVVSALLQLAVVHVAFLNLAFGTVPLSSGQWLLCVAMASAVLWFSELRKLVARLNALTIIRPRQPVADSAAGDRSASR